jgi:Ca-activated chloride channel family protein
MEYGDIATEEVQAMELGNAKSKHYKRALMRSNRTADAMMSSPKYAPEIYASSPIGGISDQAPRFNTEDYGLIQENRFLAVKQEPLSTFSIDVDAASYSNIRRFVNNGGLPPKDAVRIEEMVNYFTYDYPQPEGEHPFSVTTELSECPWNPDHQLIHIGLQGEKIPTDNLPPSNLVFLLDVSGSMDAPNKLPLLKSSFKLLTDQMRPQDKVAIVVYASASGVVLEPTSGQEKSKILAALNDLEAGGSTAGGAGIQLAYKLAREHFVEGGNNRVILATDGDFNVGASSDAELVRMIEKERKSGTFLTILGFGMGNYKDNKMQQLANHGNGNHAYIDNIEEARKVLVTEFGGTMFTIAKDVKLQLEFNPAYVEGYRLIGYENRLLQNEDFNDDRKDAGELGSGHTVTALYEIIPAGQKSDFLQAVDELKYQDQAPAKGVKNGELMTVKLRYKQPDGETSQLLQSTLSSRGTDLKQSSANFRWSAAVAELGMLLRDSEYKGKADYEQVLQLAKGAKGEDEQGYRAEFLRMVRSIRDLAAPISAEKE